MNSLHDLKRVLCEAVLCGVNVERRRSSVSRWETNTNKHKQTAVVWGSSAESCFVEQKQKFSFRDVRSFTREVCARGGGASRVCTYRSAARCLKHTVTHFSHRRSIHTFVRNKNIFITKTQRQKVFSELRKKEKIPERLKVLKKKKNGKEVYCIQ